MLLGQSWKPDLYSKDTKKVPETIKNAENLHILLHEMLHMYKQGSEHFK